MLLCTWLLFWLLTIWDWRMKMEKMQLTPVSFLFIFLTGTKYNRTMQFVTVFLSSGWVKKSRTVLKIHKNKVSIYLWEEIRPSPIKIILNQKSKQHYKKRKTKQKNQWQIIFFPKHSIKASYGDRHKLKNMEYKALPRSSAQDLDISYSYWNGPRAGTRV